MSETRSAVLRRTFRPVPALPLTTGALLVLISTTVVLTAYPAEASAATRFASTNVHNLAIHPVAALVTSMFVAPGLSWQGIVLFALSCGLVENRLGIRRTIIIAMAGQVIATLLTEYGAEAASGLHLIVASSPTRSDVGVSYAMYSLLGGAALLLPPRVRSQAFALLAATVAFPLVADPGMTTTGHVLSLTLGTLAAAVVLRVDRQRPRLPAPPREIAIRRDDRIDLVQDVRGMNGDGAPDRSRRPSCTTTSPMAPWANGTGIWPADLLDCRDGRTCDRWLGVPRAGGGR